MKVSIAELIEYGEIIGGSAAIADLESDVDLLAARVVEQQAELGELYAALDRVRIERDNLRLDLLAGAK